MGENCTDYAKLYNTTGFRIASAFTMAAGAITIICAVSTAVVIFASQSHRLYHFRLILYYCISAALFGLANCINRIDYAFASDPTRRDQSCAGAGFIFQYAMWSLLISILSVTLSINVKMTLKRDLKGTEPASLFAAFVLPLLINWIPFVKQGYGRWGNYCIIRIYDEKCVLYQFGNVSAIVLVGMPWTVGIVAIIAVTSVSIVLTLYRTRTRKGDDKGYDDLVKKVTRKEALSLLWCPLALLLLVAPIIAVLFNDTRRPTLWLWGVCEFLIALDPGLLAVAYTYRKYLLVLKKYRVVCTNDTCTKRSSVDLEDI